MASKRNIDIRALSTEELQQELVANESQYNKLKLANTITGIENPNTIPEMRRDIARIKTEMRARQLAEMTEGQVAKRSKIRARRRK